MLSNRVLWKIPYVGNTETIACDLDCRIKDVYEQYWLVLKIIFCFVIYGGLTLLAWFAPSPLLNCLVSSASLQPWEVNWQTWEQKWHQVIFETLRNGKMRREVYLCYCIITRPWYGLGCRGEREFPFPVIPGNTSLKFPVPSLPMAS